MKVLFLWADTNTNFASWNIHVGLGYLSAFLKQAGHTTDLLKFIRKVDREKFHDLIKDAKPDLLAFTVVTDQFDYSVKLAGWAKEIYPNTPIIFGGHHPTLAPEETMAVPSIDMICRGEGEEALLELVERIEAGKDYSDVRNLWVKKSGKVIRNDIRPLTENLDEMPFMDLEIFRLEELFKQTGIYILMMAGRGCPFKCTYCCNPAINRLYKDKGTITRIRSAERVLDELKHHIRMHPRISYIQFADETFNLRKEWAIDFCTRYSREIGLPFSTMVRPERLDEEIVAALSSTGCDRLEIGVENGNEWMRHNILKREMTNEEIINAFDLAAKYGLRTRAFAIVGLPHETPEMVEETIALLKRCDPNVLQLSVFYPLPGTELYEECRRNNWMTKSKETDVDTCFDKSDLNLPTITKKQISHYFHLYSDYFLQRVAKKETYGLYDFLVHLDEADIGNTNPEFVCVTQFAEEHPRRYVIQAHPPSQLTYRGVLIPEDVVLDFDISMAPLTYEMEGGGVEFLVNVNGKTIFKHALDVKHKEQDRGWHEFQLNLKKFGGMEVDVSFITRSPDNRFCTAGWGRPVLMAKGEPPGGRQPLHNI